MSRNVANIEADYQAAGFGNRLGFGRRPALLLVDAMAAYIEPSSPLYVGAQDELRCMARLLKAAHEARIAVIFTRVVYTPGGADGGYFYKKIKALKVLDEGNPLNDFTAALRPSGDDLVVTKKYASAYFGTALASLLATMGCDSVLIGGFSTSGCVRASALDTMQNGFIPIVVKDACGDRDENVHNANLFDMAAKYADVVSETEALEHLKQLKLQNIG